MSIEPVISVIIPVYNAEEYIACCIESVQNQSIKEIEIVCIDDGSVDRSSDIIRRMQRTYDNIAYYYQPNEGAANARNRGMAIARGEYIAFLDCDDYYLDPKALEMMINRCKRSRVDACGSIMTIQQDDVQREANNASEIRGLSQYDCVSFEEEPFDYDFTTFVFKRHAIVSNHITFPALRYYEDPPFLARALYHIGEFTFVDVKLYCYRFVERSKAITADKTKDLIRGIQRNIELSNKYGLGKLFEKTLFRLEYEYSKVICRNAHNEKEKIQNELLSLNKSICKKYRKEYTNRPLQIIMSPAYECYDCYEEYVLDKMRKNHRIFLYGAGQIAQRIYLFAKKYALEDHIVGFVVTEKGEKQTRYMEKPVYSIEEYAVISPGWLLLSIDDKYLVEVEHILKEKQIERYEIIYEDFYE